MRKNVTTSTKFALSQVSYVRRLPVVARFLNCPCAGFYGATYMKGFRDRFDIDVDAILQLISALEVRANDSAKDAERINEEIRIASKRKTHVYANSSFSLAMFFHR
jgi:hypothetical protein